MTKTNPQLSGAIRTITGKKVKQLRKQGLIPATIYGQEMKPMSVQFVDREIGPIWDHVGESGLVDLTVDGKKMPILFRNPQYHAVMGSLMHIDCFKVNLKEKITTTVPLEFVGESLSVKSGNVLVEALSHVEVEALPTDLPEKIEVDLTKLETLESQITIADLVVDQKVTIKNDPTEVVVKTEEPRAEEEPVVESTETVVAPAMNQKTEEEKAADEAAKAAEKKKEEK